MYGTREHNGYLQVCNGYQRQDGTEERRWQYVVKGFRGDSGAVLALWGGGATEHPIDDKNRILVRTGAGTYRKIGPKHWHH